MNWKYIYYVGGFPGGSAGKESACNAGDPGLIPGLGRFPAEGIGNPLQYSWTSLVAQMVKKPPTMWDTWVWSLGWEDPLKKRVVTHFSILALENSMDRGAWQATVHRVPNSWTQQSDLHFIMKGSKFSQQKKENHCKLSKIRKAAQ